ncbi:MAG: TonB-dependent receptor [Proteobacteria bacterium]|nr:TonB-dependent receptor [Pseudomonadota bacterium]
MAVPAAILFVLLAPPLASAANAPSDQLEEVTVTGTLIPLPVSVANANPVTVITAKDLETKGFISVADALQRSSFATGAVQGAQFVGGFTPGAQVLSMFGLAPGYTKTLMDGRAIADYPALYNGTDIVTDLSTIPTILIDRIDILPGGQSSIYGSDAIAGVVNIILRKKQDGLQADGRIGWTQDGGGAQKRFGLSEGFSIGKLDVLFGGQYDKIDPIWGFQRSRTRQYFAGGTSPQTAERDWLILGYDPNTGGFSYDFQDPVNCANVAGQFGGTVTKAYRASRNGYYCGTTSAGYYTLNNGTEATQGFLHASYDLAGGAQLFGDVLISHANTRFNTGTVLYDSSSDGSPFSYYSDPNVNNGHLLNLQRIFSPEEAGNLRGQSNKDTNNSVRATFGVQGDFATAWKYSLDMTYTENKLTEATHLAFTSAIENFFAPIYGPLLGTDVATGASLYSPDYSQFYRPITPAEYASFTGYATSYSRTEDSLVRGQLTNSSLFGLPGGDAGLAAVIEGGRQGWNYAPDPRFLDGETYLYSAVGGSGHRTRYAGSLELRLPVLQTVTATASGRYDDYKVSDQNVDKFTYNLGLEYRPLKPLLLRGRYGTAFKAPTLADEFQGKSGYFITGTDYYTCAKAGFAPGNPPPNDIASCTQSGIGIAGSTQGNPTLKPINATVTDLGVVWSPLARSSFSVDYYTWKIRDEVQTLDSDQLLRTESACRLGQLDPNSPTCQNAIADVTRDPTTGLIVSILTPKENLAKETLHVLSLTANYTWEAGRAGNFTFDAAYTDVLRHRIVRFPGDPEIDYLNSPFYSTEFKTKANLAVSWEFDKFTSTVYAEYYGKTPNNAAQLQVEGYAAPHAGDVNPWTIINASVQYEALPGLTFTGNVNNVFNRSPPYDATFTGIDNQPYNIFNYNDYGRTFFLGVNYKMHK